MDDKGFTIIELVLVIIVIAIIAAVAVPQFARYYDGITVRNAAVKIASDIRYAQNRATTTQQRSQVSFVATGYTINYCTSANYNVTTCTCASWTQDKITDWATTTSEFFGVTLSSSQNPLEFDSLGRPYSTTTCIPLAVTTTITASYSGSPKDITVTQQTGMVSY